MRLHELQSIFQCNSGSSFCLCLLGKLENGMISLYLLSARPEIQRSVTLLNAKVERLFLCKKFN
jgi:hypothetical protein